ncbi:aminomethyl-transferring glycine dehydrogenase subunit GcvPA [Tichowtungia aerotolerans]|uniref:Probable glycine dehydrogenase (decarboxylating) subunit 1 n=1 Tax=Tichowtungia aerotolerans TaxID=2697043 RepID=A0A6P1M652_9BACT|nr:aminomethyl-transferring glycine dehydrogenase subunit GcvPA [Tichowtungia aerotolerans]QHI70060.1 aminomethyl-transferring glycine dehydrogenase subunit GcvPA [Tichowtungia aerotolerans]
MSHTPFVCTSPADEKAMLHAVDAESFDDLFSHIPAEFQTDQFGLSAGLSEMEMMQHLRKIARKNSSDLTNFCGAGFYDHFIPAAVDSLTSRGEFFTAYTPYQPEAAQGTLQAAYEYQTAIARLTGMEVSNASLYDGGTALFEGMMMALRITRRNCVLVDTGVSPIYRTMLRSYTRNLKIDYKEIPLSGGIADRDAFAQHLDDSIGAVLLQNPNFFGCIDDLTGLIEQIHRVKAVAVVSTYPVSLGLLKTPGEMGADIVTGEGQSLGMPLSFGGPYLGFMATRKKLVRNMPGRIVGATQDTQGRRGYVLTLQAREQHIRREKAASNICTNMQLCALRSIVYLSLLGKHGFADVARQCMDRAGYAWTRLKAIDGVEPLFDRPFFNEFALKLPKDASEVVSDLIEEGIAAGFPAGRYYVGMENVLLFAFTEKRTKKEIDILAARLESVL